VEARQQSGDPRPYLIRSARPWYPTKRLYRQRALGDRAGVIARVAADLAQLATAHAGAANAQGAATPQPT
jgi:hypothetical protein